MINFLIGFIAGAVIMTIIGLVVTKPKQEKPIIELVVTTSKQENVIKSIDNSSIYPNLLPTLRIWYDRNGKKHEKIY